MKVVIVRSDRPIFESLDCRRQPFDKLDCITYFLVDNEGNMISYYNYRDYYAEKDGFRSMTHTKYFRENKDGSRKIWENELFKKYISFNKKYGKIIEFSVEEFNEMYQKHLEEFESLKQELKHWIDEGRNFLSNYEKIEGKDKKGRWKKCNIPNIIMINNRTGNAYISDENTYVIKEYKNYTNSGFKIHNLKNTYWGYYQYLSSDSTSSYFGDSFEIRKVGKKGVKTFIEMMEKREKTHSRIMKFNQDAINSLF